MLKKNTLKTTKRDDMIDVTTEVQAFIMENGIQEGIALIYCPHTTAGITINENADPDVKKICLEDWMSNTHGIIHWIYIWKEILLPI